MTIDHQTVFSASPSRIQPKQERPFVQQTALVQVFDDGVHQQFATTSPATATGATTTTTSGATTTTEQ